MSNSGSQFREDGTLENWWSTDDREEFNRNAQCIIDQYGGYAVAGLPDGANTVNGVLTQGENIADNGGLREAFRAYRNSVDNFGEEPRLPGLEQFTPEQMIFMAHAQVWCEVQTLESYANQLATDPHSPGQYRVIGPLANSEDFAAAWGCQANDAMNPANKCVVW